MKNRKRRWVDALLVLALLIGLSLLAYPFFSDYWSSLHQSRAIISYVESVASLDQERYEGIWEAALAYNVRFREKENRWAMTEEELADYDARLDPNGTGNMGFISIPKVNIDLPIYHGTGEAVLQTSIGHIAESSLPVGSRRAAGEGEDPSGAAEFASHCVLSGHRGLPSAKLFSDLDMLEVGDVFLLTVLDQTLTYEVDQIAIVEPDDPSLVALVPGMDLVTLVTCTPYGINTHRLLVRGHRIENERPRLDVRVTADAVRIDAVYVAPFIAAPVLLLLAAWVLMLAGRRTRR